MLCFGLRLSWSDDTTVWNAREGSDYHLCTDFVVLFLVFFPLPLCNAFGSIFVHIFQNHIQFTVS